MTQAFHQSSDTVTLLELVYGNYNSGPWTYTHCTAFKLNQERGKCYGVTNNEPKRELKSIPTVLMQFVIIRLAKYKVCGYVACGKVNHYFLRILIWPILINTVGLHYFFLSCCFFSPNLQVAIFFYLCFRLCSCLLHSYYGC